MTAKTPEPFRVHVSDDTLQDLRSRLENTRWPDEIPGSEWAYGTNLGYLRRLVEHWLDGFDWRAQEAKLNAFAQFRVPLADIHLHFIHEPGVGPDPYPLLLAHGWPGSVWEFSELIPRLTDPGRFGGDPADAFTVVAPSLPGYTFSYAPGQRRFDVAAISDVCADLMTDVLGYPQFAAQGGDWGGYVVGGLGARHGEKVCGIHLNFLPIRGDIPFPDELSEKERIYQGELAHWQKEETGYHAIQGTKPQTLAYALTDSPAGLAGWMIEKFQTWSDHRGDFEGWLDRDSLLTNVMLYWVTGAINSSFWPYYAIRHDPWPLPDAWVATPTGYAEFPVETRHPPRSFAETAFNIQRWTEMPRGGHFAALEVPDLLAEDVAAFFRPLRRG